MKPSSKHLPKLLAIVGPTASGKSELAVELAKRIARERWGGFEGAEIISADSRQVYTHLNIGSNKVPGTWKTKKPPSGKKGTKKAIVEFVTQGESVRKIFLYKTIPHHCIDFVHPKKTFTVAEYKKCAEAAINDLASRYKVPILVGGTGLYVQAVVDDVTVPEVPPNWGLRKKLGNKSPVELFRMLKKLGPQRAASIDAKNSRRLIRAIEIVKATRKPVVKLEKSARFNLLIIGLKQSEAKLRETLAKRTWVQLRGGLLQEVQKLRRLGLTKKRIRELGFEYSICLQYFGDPISEFRRLDLRKLIQDKLEKENWRYVKRQMTWFRRDRRIHWLQNPGNAALLVKKFLEK